jgi:poly(3-hydroxybutyrate) depolymerase
MGAGRRSGLRLACAFAAAAFLTSGIGAADVRLGAGTNGGLGAWLVAGPYKAAPDGLASPPPGLGSDDRSLAATWGKSAGNRQRKKRPEPTRWTAIAAVGTFDLAKQLDTTGGDQIAYAAMDLEVQRSGRYGLLLSADDGVRVSLDDKVLFTRDGGHAFRDDDELVWLDLSEGRHELVVKLHQKDGGWSFRARLVNASFEPAARVVSVLPGVTDAVADELQGRLVQVRLDRGLDGAGYTPKLRVWFEDGMPLGRPIEVRSRLVAGDASFDVLGGAMPEGAELRLTLPRTDDAALAAIEDKPGIALETMVGSKRVSSPLVVHGATRRAVARADATLARLGDKPPPGLTLRDGTRATVTHLAQRLRDLAGRGDADLESQDREAKELASLCDALDGGQDPFETRTGPMRRAYVAAADGHLAEFGFYVPPGYRPNTAQRYPLIVALHGLNGKPLAMLRWFFGGDDDKRDQEWEDRHLDGLRPLSAFVLTPAGHGNAFYRGLGEEDVMGLVEWAKATYPVDPQRITITGPSMGGIGTAALAFRHPDTFAAAAPLCGYHSYFIRGDVMGKPLRPWERFLAEERSNVEWAVNGAHIPLYIVHGTKDLPEANSGVLIDRYEKLRYSVKHEHPDLGHNVWQTTYEDLKGARWLMMHKHRDRETRAHFRTTRPRYGHSGFVEVRELLAPGAWGEVDARIIKNEARASGATGEVRIQTSGVRELGLDPMDEPEIKVKIDGAELTFARGEPLLMHKETSGWAKGPRPVTGLAKRGGVTGPIRDVFHSPILFVYGTESPELARVSEDVARGFATMRYGTTVQYPVISDRELYASGGDLKADRSLFLVGTSASNRVLRELEADLPMRIETAGGPDATRALVLGGKRFAGPGVGASYIYPHPRRPGRYVVVVTGLDAEGIWRGLSIPDLSPDFLVYDAKIAPAKGQTLLGSASILAGGLFTNDWKLPEKL